MRKKRHYGSQLHYSTDNVTYTQVTDMRMITPPPFAKDVSDITVLESPGEGDEKMPGPNKTGEIKCAAAYNEARYATLIALQTTTMASYDTDNPLYFRIRAGLGFGQATRDTLITRGFITEVKEKEYKNDNSIKEIEFTIQEANVSRAFTPGA